VRDSPRWFCVSRRELGIYYSGPNLDSGLFRVIQHRALIQADLREKTGMTVLGVFLYKRHNPLIRALFMLPLFALSVVLLFVALYAPLLPGEVPKEASYVCGSDPIR